MARERSLALVRRLPVALLLAGSLATATLAGCGGGGGSDDEAATTTEPEVEVPAECVAAPVTVEAVAAGERPAGSESFEATDVVALRTPILPGEMAFDGSGLSGLQSKAEITPLASYSVYLADFEVPREEIAGRSLGIVTPPAGQTLAVLSLVPPTEAGLATGDVIANGELGYETNSSLSQLSLAVYADGDTTGMASTDVIGQAEVLHVDDEQLCVAFDVTFENQGELVYAGSGTVLAPVVRSDPAFFFT
jgi:hypothetical protein